MYRKLKIWIGFVSKKINKILEKFLIFLFAILILLVIVNVILRYVFHRSLFIVTELANYLLVYLVFLGASVALYQNEHVHIEINYFRIPYRLKQVIEKIGVILNCIFILILTLYGTKLAVMNRVSFTGVVQIPMGIVYAVIPVSGIIMVIQYVDLLLNKKEQKLS